MMCNIFLVRIFSTVSSGECCKKPSLSVETRIVCVVPSLIGEAPLLDDHRADREGGTCDAGNPPPRSGTHAGNYCAYLS